MPELADGAPTEDEIPPPAEAIETIEDVKIEAAIEDLPPILEAAWEAQPVAASSKTWIQKESSIIGENDDEIDDAAAEKAGLLIGEPLSDDEDEVKADEEKKVKAPAEEIVAEIIPEPYPELATDDFGGLVLEPLSNENVRYTEPSNPELAEEEEKSIILSESSHEPTPIDREPYIIIYKTVIKDYGLIKRHNNYLQKKMTEYFKRRKMEHVFRESEHYNEALAKYKIKLNLYDQLIKEDTQKRYEITTKLNEMHATKSRQLHEVTKNFQELVLKERETGTGLIMSKTGKHLPEKLLERMLQNQITKSKELEQLRLSFIKVRNAVMYKHQAIRTLDKIGENWSLMEYEQLKMENQGHIDKIEERDEELTRLRAKCSGGIQCLAHIREKCSALTTNIAETKHDLGTLEVIRAVARETVNKIKKERDNFRAQTQKLKNASGLLLKPKLLIDMEYAMGKTKLLEKEVANIEVHYKRNKRYTKAIKSNLEAERKRRIVEKTNKAQTTNNKKQKANEKSLFTITRPLLDKQ